MGDREFNLNGMMSDAAIKEAEMKLHQEYEEKFEAFKKQAVEEKLVTLKREYEEKIANAKTKQWCRKCLKEATSVCCFGTLYCSSECQHQDWNRHRTQCQRAKN